MSPFIFHGLTGDLKVDRPQKIKIGIEKDFLSLTKQKLSLARYPEEQIDFGPQDWSQGAKVSAVKELAEYWQKTYDWSAQEVSPCCQPCCMNKHSLLSSAKQY